MRRPIFTGSKSIIVKANAMTQQTEMFVRLVELGEIPMQPNANGLFTVDQVAALASKRGCSIHKAGDLTIEIKHPGQGRGQWKHASIMAHDTGLWHPIAIFRGCREAAGQPHYDIDYGKAKIKNPGNLNEVLIAQIVGADGVRPYLSRPSQYFTNLRVVDDGICRAEIPDKGVAGGWTFPMFCLFNATWIINSGKSYDYRRAVRALDDAGLLKLTVGPRGGFGTATFEWLPAAYLAAVEHKETLHHADSEFFCDLMAVS